MSVFEVGMQVVYSSFIERSEISYIFFNYNFSCILFTFQGRPGTPKLKLEGDSQHFCPLQPKFGGDSSCLSAHYLRHWWWGFATEEQRSRLERLLKGHRRCGFLPE